MERTNEKFEEKKGEDKAGGGANPSSPPSHVEECPCGHPPIVLRQNGQVICQHCGRKGPNTGTREENLAGWNADHHGEIPEARFCLWVGANDDVCPDCGALLTYWVLEREHHYSGEKRFFRAPGSGCCMNTSGKALGSRLSGPCPSSAKPRNSGYRLEEYTEEVKLPARNTTKEG